MTTFQLAALLLVLVAAFGLLNHHVLKLPSTVGLLAMSLVGALLITLANGLFPDLGLYERTRTAVLDLDLGETLLEGMLGYILFAGALHVDFGLLRRRAFAIAALASVGVMISILVIGVGFTVIAGAPLMVGLVFGAIISPTDPVAVLGVLKTAKVPEALEVKIAGESLFNDGIGYVAFLIIVALAFGASGGEGGAMGAGAVLSLFVQEAVGGALLGGLAGLVAFFALRRTDDPVLEVVVTLALVTGTYALANALHMSGPIAVVVAGLFIGNTGRRHGMGEETQRYVAIVWEVIDEVLNAVLFLVIGLEVLALDLEPGFLLLGLAAIPLALGARLLAVGLPIGVLSFARDFTRGAVPLLTWAGLRGGISVALALTLPDSEWKPALLTATYVVVVFSILVQGSSMRWAVRRFVAE